MATASRLLLCCHHTLRDRNQAFVKDLLDVADNFARAVATVPADVRSVLTPFAATAARPALPSSLSRTHSSVIPRFCLVSSPSGPREARERRAGRGHGEAAAVAARGGPADGEGAAEGEGGGGGDALRAPISLFASLSLAPGVPRASLAACLASGNPKLIALLVWCLREEREH